MRGALAAGSSEHGATRAVLALAGSSRTVAVAPAAEPIGRARSLEDGPSRGARIAWRYGAGVPLERLGDEYADAVLAFEVENRSYFARTISDRGDEYFSEYPERHRALMVEQAAGVGAYHVLVDEHGSVVGRFNLYELHDGSAVVGYRVAERVAGRGVATAGVRELCDLAAELFGLRSLVADVSDANGASRRVLEKVGFTPAGPTDVGGRPGTSFRLVLGDGPAAREPRGTEASSRRT